MKKIESLKVMYHGKLVGRMTMGTNGTCLFQYGKLWLDTGFSISPLELPLKPDIFEAKPMPFNGNFGVFEDCVPGGYGEYMLTKELRKHGINYPELDPLQKLSIVGSSGMGALCYVPDNKIAISGEDIDLDKMQQEALDVLSEKTDEYTSKLYLASGNSGGVRPKVLINADGRSWIVKFRQTYDPVDAGLIEFMYNKAAQKAGITVPRFKLFNGRYFGEERFDITSKGERIHIVTASGLLNEGINPPKMDYNALLALTGYITQSPSEVEQQFRRMVFNFYAENFDDHARNFSFFYVAGKWKLSPAYDMTHDSSLGTHATSVGYTDNPTDEDLVNAGTTIRIPRKQCEAIIDEIKPIGKELVIRIKNKDYDLSQSNV